MILVTGASGNAGGAVLNAALKRQLPVRALYRSTADAQGVPQGVDATIADFADTASLPAALDGIDAVYLVCAPVPQLVALESNVIDACKASGVRHVVLNSALGAGHFAKSFPSWHLQVEDKLKAAGLDYTIIRPNGFMQNIAAFNAASIKADGAFYAAMGDARVSLIDVRDVGGAVASILTEPRRHAGEIYELNGPEALSNADVAAHISHVIGTTVTFVDIPEDAQRQAMLGVGMPEWQVTAVLELQAYYRGGHCAAGSEVTARLLNTAPRTLEAYLHENAAVFQRRDG